MGKISSTTINDFFDVLNTHLDQNLKDDPMEIGLVESINPLQIKVGELPLYANNLYINRYLLAWDEVVTVEYNDTTTTQTIHHPRRLNVGDYVGLYGLEWNEVGKTYQRYYMLDIIQ